jgi:hypothetical protein
LPPLVINGYLQLHRSWKTGDVIRLILPRTLRTEPTPDDPPTVAFLFGPLVLAGDLGPATQRWDGLAPVLVGNDLSQGIVPGMEAAEFRTQGVVHPTDLTLRPFTFQHDQNTAVYFRRFAEAEWQQEQVKFQSELMRLRELDAHSTDVVRLGDADAEREHSLESKSSYAVVYRGRTGRDARPGPLILQATYWARSAIAGSPS